MRRPPLRTIAAAVGKTVVYVVAILLVLVGVGISVLETGWAKDRIRGLIVRQANEYLTATLQIGRLEGSLLRGLQLGDIRLSRDGHDIITIDEVALSYSLRELWQRGTIVRRIRLVHPSFSIAKQPDGRWNISALVKRETKQERNSGPGRPIELQSIEVVDGRVRLGDPLEFGAAHVPSDFEHLNIACAFRYEPVTWTLDFANASWMGRAPDLDMTRLSGRLANGPDGWRFDRFSVRTPQSAFVLDGPISRREGEPTTLDLAVRADRFAFQEWGGIIHGLRNIAVDASFTTKLRGPVDRLATDLRLAGTGGSVNGGLVLDTTVPGWRGTGAVDIARLDLARWLNRPDRPSDITGHVAFDLDLDLGGHFPRGTYRFDGSHAMYMDYAADNVHSHGRLTATEVQIDQATASAYGSDVVAGTGSTIGLDEPFPFRFVGAIGGIDLRRLPAAVPVPHVESRLAFEYDVTGRFSDPFISGKARFGASEFLGATIGPGTTGAIDTQASPLQFSGEGEIDGIDLNRMGAGLDIGWMQDPRYEGGISGRFHVDGSGTDRRELVLHGGGRIARALLFHGTITDADATFDLEHGAMKTSFDGHFNGVDPSIAFGTPSVAGSLAGSASVTTNVRDLLADRIPLQDYEVSGTVDLQHSTLRGFDLDTARVAGTLAHAVAHLTDVETAGPALSGRGSGTIAFTDDAASSFDFDVTRADLAQLRLGSRVSGVVATKGHVQGRDGALRATGSATVTQPGAGDVSALAADGDYDVTVPSGDAAASSGRLTLHASFVTVAGQSVQDVRGVVTRDGQRIGVDAQLRSGQGRQSSIKGDALLDLSQRRVELQDLTLAFGNAPWRLASAATPPAIRWTGQAFAVDPMTFVAGAAADQRITIGGDWRRDGAGALRVTASHVFLETIEGAFEGPARYGGVLDLDATVRGTAAAPTVTADLSITSGRVRRLTYHKLAGRVDYAGSGLAIDLRLDQSPDTWVTARGTVPRSLFDRSAPDRPMDVAILSTPIKLGLLEGVTDVVRNVTGTLRVDVRAVGSGRDPHFQGLMELSDAGFLSTTTGSRYKNAHAVFRFSRQRVDVDALHIEDAGGHPLDVHGSLATHELTVGGLRVDARARGFEVVHDEYGKVSIDADLHVGGRFESPRVTGDLTIDKGADVRVDRVLERALFQPYATEAAPIGEVDAIAALNPWDRLGLDLSLHVPNTLKLTGDNVQVSSGTPIGLGNIDLRVAGDLYLYKDPQKPLSVTGSLDQVSGTYGFQGRRFDVDPTSSINFRGDLNPELYVTVTRLISGVDTRVTITGSLRQPELQLHSTPPLDASAIMSLIVFNTAPNELSTQQQQELAVRAGALAAGFIATPVVAALQNQIGLDVLEVDPTGGDLLSNGPKVTVGEEFAPGLVARFTRQFGSEPYDEATIEYYLSRILRLRATFSDAQSLEARSPFLRLERAGIDLMFFFSF